MKDKLEFGLIALYGVLTILSTICSAVVVRFTPLVTIIFIILEVLNITSYGIWTVIGYGLITFIGALFILGLNMLVLAMATE